MNHHVGGESSGTFICLNCVFARWGDWEGSILVIRRDEEPGQQAGRPELDAGGGDDRGAGLALARQDQPVRVGVDQP